MANAKMGLLLAALPVALSLAVVSLGTAPALAEGSCRPVTASAGFDIVVAVEGVEAPYRLVCRDRRLTAVPLSGIADTSTGANAAGVAGQMPAASISEAIAEPADGARSAMPRPDDATAGTETPEKAPISQAAAAPEGAGGAGARKSESRIEPAPEDAPNARVPETPLALDDGDGDAEPKMVRIPAPVIGAAMLALPGVRFKSVALQREGASTVYMLTGQTESGRAVAVDVDKAATILKVDRQIDVSEIPASVRRIADALLPGADIERAMLSSRDNFEAFFIFAATDAAARPITVEIRSDGRSIRFLGED